MEPPDDTTRSMRGKVLAGRYKLGETIGHGGASVVYGAVDDVTGRHVAVKLLYPGGARIGERARREIAALRLLRLPGVVTLQDEGEFEGSPFLVMELIDGAPFPGCAIPAAWHDLAAPTLSMLETLARVHTTGVVHRDLKPSNILVRDDLTVTILDFGVSWGPALGEALTAVGGIVGTPEYLAPEQLTGIRGDPRSDLYAIGALLYEALTGQLPHVADNLFALLNLKRTVTPLPVRQLAPDVPRRVAQTVELLLSLEPDDRPQSVWELLHVLYDKEVTKLLTSVLPRLGDAQIVDDVTRRVLADESVDVTGPRGCGRSRLLTDVASELTAKGRRPRWTPPGTAPYSSALALLGDLPGLEDLDRAALEERLHEEIARAIAGGSVFVIDEPAQIDAWSMGVFAGAHANGGFVRVVPQPTPGCVVLPRLSERDLRPLFAGPDRIFHLREDGAAELFGRTGGLPSRVAAEIGAWVRAGLARWHDGLIVVTRDALQQLAGGLPVIATTFPDVDEEPDAPGLQDLMAWITLAWPHTSEDVLAKATKRPAWRLQPELEALAQRHRITRLDDGRYQPVASSAALRVWPPDRVRNAHRSLADALPPGTPDRLRHLAVSGSVDEVVRESVQRSDDLCKAGRYVDARVAAEIGLVAARRAGDESGEHLLLRSIAHFCLDDGSRTAIQHGLYDLGRALHRDEELASIERLLVIAREAETAPPHELLESLKGIGPLADRTLELWRRGQQYRISMRLGRAQEAETISEIEAWGAGSADASDRGSLESWMLLAEFHAGHPIEAAHAMERAAAAATTATMRLTNQINAAFAYGDAGQPDDAERLARSVQAESAAGRAASFEAHAEAVLRFAAYQRGQTMAPDSELVACVATLGDTALEARTTMTEAAIAWRIGELGLARELAAKTTELCRLYAEPGSDALPRALEILCGADPEPGELAALEATARDCPDADTTVQTLGMLAMLLPDRAAELHAEALRRTDELTYGAAETRRIVLSVAEATGGSIGE